MALPSAWDIYDQCLNQLGQKTLNLNADGFKVALYTSASDCGSRSHATAKYGDFTNEVANANGYVTGGVSVGSGSFINVSGTQHFDVGIAVFSAVGGTITARYAVVYDNTDANKRAVAFCLLDSAPANYVIASGGALVLGINDVFTLVRIA